MKYQSLWWKIIAVLLVLGVGAKLLYSARADLLPELFSRPDAPSSAPAAGRDDSWLSAESAGPAGAREEDGEPVPAFRELRIYSPPETETPEPSLIFSPPSPEEKKPSVRINDLTHTRPDIDALTQEGWPYELAADKPQILIIHTHTCEAYTASEADGYTQSDPFRTLDKEKSVVRVGDVLAQRLEELGFNVVHDDTLFDYPEYSGSYGRSQAATESWLEKYPSIRVVIDLHRDSAAGGYRTEYTHGGEKTAQLMLLVTTGEAELYHPHWKDNLRLALLLQGEMQERYEGLARDLCLSPYRYNQHLSPGSLILEVGSDGNTLEEAEAAVLLFAECAGEVLKDKIK